MDTLEREKGMKFSPKIYTQQISYTSVETGQLGVVKNCQQHMNRVGQIDMDRPSFSVVEQNIYSQLM